MIVHAMLVASLQILTSSPQLAGSPGVILVKLSSTLRPQELYLPPLYSGDSLTSGFNSERKHKDDTTAFCLTI